MQQVQVAVYLDEWRLPVNPASLRFRLPTHSASYELVGAGEAEILQGAKLADIHLEGFFPGGLRHYALSTPPAEEAVLRIQKMVEESRPVRFIYIGNAWDINLLVSVQSPEFREVGGSNDIEYKIDLRKWVDVGPELLVDEGARRRRAQTKKASASNGGGSYTVKKNDTLSHIAHYALGDASRWREIYELNKDIIGNPNLIYPGQTLKMPDGAKSVPVATAKKVTGGGGSKKSGAASASSNKTQVVKDQSGNGKLVVGANLVPGLINANNTLGSYGRK